MKFANAFLAGPREARAPPAGRRLSGRCAGGIAGPPNSPPAPFTNFAIILNARKTQCIQWLTGNAKNCSWPASAGSHFTIRVEEDSPLGPGLPKGKPIPDRRFGLPETNWFVCNKAFPVSEQWFGSGFAAGSATSLRTARLPAPVSQPARAATAAPKIFLKILAPTIDKEV